MKKYEFIDIKSVKSLSKINMNDMILLKDQEKSTINSLTDRRNNSILTKNEKINEY